MELNPEAILFIKNIFYKKATEVFFALPPSFSEVVDNNIYTHTTLKKILPLKMAFVITS